MEKQIFACLGLGLIREGKMPGGHIAGGLLLGLQVAKVVGGDFLHNPLRLHELLLRGHGPCRRRQSERQSNRRQ